MKAFLVSLPGMTRTEEKSILNLARSAAMFLVSLSNSSFRLARLNTRSLQSENCFLQLKVKIRLNSIKSAPSCEYVGNKESEASIVVEPPDIDGSASLLCALLELGDVPHNFLCKRPANRNKFETTKLDSTG